MAIRIPTRQQPPQNPSVVAIDGSALYAASRAIVADQSYRLDYRAFAQKLISHVPALGMPKPPEVLWTMWTAAAPDNAGQNNFLDFIERDLHWEVRRVFPSQAFLIEPMALFGVGNADSSKYMRLVRFDASIAFAMGRAAASHRIVVVSDSFSLYEPLARIAEKYPDRKPYLAFFGRALDSRWHVALKKDAGPEFLDLDEWQAELFGMPGKEAAKAGAQAGNELF